MTPQELREKVMAGFTEKLRSADNDSIVDYEACLMDAAINIVLDAAAEVAEETMVLCDIMKPGTGPFTRQDRAVDQTREQIATAILSLKAKG